MRLGRAAWYFVGRGGVPDVIDLRRGRILEHGELYAFLRTSSPARVRSALVKFG